MEETHYQFMRRKQRRQRVIVISLVCIILSGIAVSLRECNQSITEPLDKAYHAYDQPDKPLK
jgi:hypothetical protein